MMVVPQLFTGRDPNAIEFLERLKPPSLAHPFGTDENGRDLWARVVHGARPTLTAAVALILISLAVLGSLAGLVIGAAGRRADEVLMRVTEFFLAFPQIVWALAIASVIGRGLVVCVLALGLTWWAQYARLMRAQVLVYTEREFILASRALGQRQWRILLLHLLPNCFSPVLVKATIDVSLAILLLAALSFLGVGAQPPLPEWGAMVTIGRKYLLDYPWYATFPGLAIFVVVLAFNILGERVRDVLDPSRAAVVREAPDVRLVLRRLPLLVVLLAAISLAVFTLTQYLPGDPAFIAAGGGDATPEMIAARPRAPRPRPAAVGPLPLLHAHASPAATSAARSSTAGRSSTTSGSSGRRRWSWRWPPSRSAPSSASRSVSSRRCGPAAGSTGSSRPARCSSAPCRSSGSASWRCSSSTGSSTSCPRADVSPWA